MARWIVVGLIVFFNFSALRAQQPPAVTYEEALELCTYALTETEIAQCFPLAWSVLTSANFLISAARSTGTIEAEDLDYHVGILTNVTHGFLDLDIEREANEAGLGYGPYLATTDFLIRTLDIIINTNTDSLTEAQLFVYTLAWEARLEIFDVSSETPPEYLERRQLAEERINQVLEPIFGDALTGVGEDAGGAEDGE